MTVPDKLWDLFESTRAEHAGVVSTDIHGDYAALAAVLARVAEQIAAYRCGYEMCSECSCRADLIKRIGEKS